MINFLLKNPSLYRFYQKTVRAKYDEFDFFKFIFKQNNFKNVRMLDICCGDSYILEHISEFIDDYFGGFIMIFCCESLSKCLGGIWFLAIQKLRAWGDTPKKAATSLFRLRPWFIIRLFIISLTFSIIINYFCIYYLFIQYYLNKIN